MIKDEVYNIIAKKMRVSINKISDDSRIVEDLNADSLDSLEIVIEIEERYGIEIVDNDAENIKTVKDAILIIERKLNASSKIQ